MFVSGHSDGSIRVGSIDNPDDGEMISTHHGSVQAIAVTKLGGRMIVVSTGMDRKLRIAGVAERRELVTLDLDGQGLAVTALGNLVGLGTSTGTSALRLNEDQLGELN